MSAQSVVLAASGGLGFAAAGFRLTAQEVVYPLFVSYGQASAAWEWRAVRALAAARSWKEPVRIECQHLAELSNVGTRFGSDRGGAASATTGLLDDGSAPVMLEILLTAAHWSYRKGVSRVICGLYRNGDLKAIQPDQLVPWHFDVRGFVHAANHLLAMTLPATCGVEIEAPLADLGAAEVRKLAQRLQVPIASTRTCATSSETSCSRCGACRRYGVGAEVSSPEVRTAAVA